MKKLDMPTWRECDERLEALSRTDRTVAQSAMNGVELTPLEAVIHAYDDADPRRSKQFIAAIKKLAEWCVNNPDHVLSQHEAL